VFWAFVGRRSCVLRGASHFLYNLILLIKKKKKLLWGFFIAFEVSWLTVGGPL